MNGLMEVTPVVREESARPAESISPVKETPDIVEKPVDTSLINSTPVAPATTAATGEESWEKFSFGE